MGFVGSFFLVLASAAAWIVFWRAYYRVDPSRDEVHFVRATDGWRVALSRYRPEEGSKKRAFPVLLCPGLGANGAGFDIEPSKASLARTLAAAGFDTWILDLRGHGLADRANPFLDRHHEWNFDDYITKDVPAALERMRQATGADKAHWVGHSMGGMVLYTHLLRGGEGIASGVTLGSSLESGSHGSWFTDLSKLKRALDFVPLAPLGVLARLYAPLAGRVESPVDEFNVWPANVDGPLYRRVLANAYHAVPSPVLRQLESAMQPGGLRSADGSIRYLDRAPDVKVPLLAIAAEHDRQASPAAVRHTLEAFTSAEKEVAEFKGYGHLDLLVGKRSAQEIYPAVLSWLEKHDG